MLFDDLKEALTEMQQMKESVMEPNQIGEWFNFNNKYVHVEDWPESNTWVNYKGGYIHKEDVGVMFYHEATLTLKVENLTVSKHSKSEVQLQFNGYCFLVDTVELKRHLIKEHMAYADVHTPTKRTPVMLHSFYGNKIVNLVFHITGGTHLTLTKESVQKILEFIS